MNTLNFSRLSFHCVCLLLGIALCCPADLHADEWFEKALQTIEAAEGRFRTVRYEAEQIPQRKFESLDKPETWSTIEPASMSRMKFLYDAGQGRYRLDTEFVSPWKNGSAPFIGGRWSLSFDGKTEREYRITKHGVEVPKPDAADLPKMGTIDHDQGYVTKKGAGGTGMSAFPPFFHHGIRLSDAIRKASEQGKPARITGEGETLWKIELPDPSNPPDRKDQFHVWYDSQRAAVTHIEVFEAGENTPWRLLRTTLQEVLPGFHVPSRFESIYLKDKTAFGINYRNIRINEPAVDESVFRIEFPKGTQVQDRVEKISYRISDGASQDRENIQKFSQAHNLRFSGETGSSGWWWWLGLVPVVVGVGVWLWWRRSRVRPAVALLAAASVLGGSISFAAEIDSKGEWVVKHAPGEAIRISQCGLNVTLFTLHYFGQEKYSLPLVTRSLPPTADGIRLKDIRDVLAGSGLRVSARQKVSPDSLARAVDSSTLAIVPIRYKTGQVHYVVLVRHPQRGLLVIDPPSRMSNFDVASAAKWLSEFDGLVLFVRPPTSGPKQAEIAQVSPTVVQLGDVRLGDPGNAQPRLYDISVRNPTSQPMLVLPGHSSCGCLRCDWPGTLLAPGEARTFQASLNHSSFGLGETEQRLPLHFGDGSETVLKWVGRGLRAERVHSLSVAGNIVRVNSADASPGGIARVERALQTGPGMSPSDFTVRAKAPWILAKIFEQGGRLALELRVDVASALGDDLKAESEVELFSVADAPPVRLQVLIQRETRYSVDRPLLRLPPAQPEAVLRITPMNPATEAPQLVPLGDIPTHLEVEPLATEGVAACIRVRRKPGATPGLYRLRWFAAPSGASVPSCQKTVIVCVVSLPPE